MGSVVNSLLDPKNIKELQDVLEYHVIAGAAIHKADLEDYQNVKTLEGKTLLVVKDPAGDVFLGDASPHSPGLRPEAKVTTADVDASCQSQSWIACSIPITSRNSRMC